MTAKFEVLLFSSILLLLSCQNRKTESSNHVNNKDTLLSKTILFSHHLLQLKGNKLQRIDSILCSIEGRQKVISIVDANCMKCIINQLNIMDSTFQNIMNDNSTMIFILNVKKNDSAYFMKNLQPEIKASGLILWDSNYNFERENDLLTSDMNLRTFLTDEENKIIGYGNPVLNPDLFSLYKEKLTKSK